MAIRITMEETEKKQSNNFTISNLLMSFVGTIFFSLILSAIAALILKKDKK